ncbi:MAG TPA: septum formation initiator family protein [Anaeromyxobacter sp.]|nr:septum formation initiator family protein [Anaeromyxobacter sp.]
MKGTDGGRRRWVVLGAVVAALAVASALDPAGLQMFLRLSGQVRDLRAENGRLAAENARLAREVRALRSEPVALERAVREELRFIRPGERVYWLGDDRGGVP